MKNWSWTHFVLALGLASQTSAHALPSFEETLNRFVNEEACVTPESPNFSRSPEGSFEVARKVHAEILAGRIAKLPFEDYMATMSSLAARYAASSACWEGLMDLFEGIQAKLPTPNALTRDERYALEREEFIAKWAGGVFFASTVLKSFSGADASKNYALKESLYQRLVLGPKGIATSLEGLVVRLERMVEFLKSSPELEVAATPAMEAAERQFAKTGFFQWKGMDPKGGSLAPLRVLREMIAGIMKTPFELKMRARTAAFLDRIAGAADPFEQMMIPAPGTSRFQPLANVFKRANMPVIGRYLLEMGVSTAIATTVYGGYRGLGFGSIAPERPQPLNLIALFQAQLILDLERRALALSEQIDQLEGKTLGVENIEEVLSLQLALSEMLKEWSHFRDRAPRFLHTAYMNADDALTLADSHELLSKSQIRLEQIMQSLMRNASSTP